MSENEINGFMAIYRAYKACMPGKQHNPTAMRYHVNAVTRCAALSDKLKAREYAVGTYYPFEVWEPKHRYVLALDFEGKVVQHSVCDNALYPAVAKRLITDNYAVQTGKGTHFGLDRLTDMLRHYFFSRKARDEELRRKAHLPYLRKHEWDYADGWVLKGDIRHYFYSLDHSVCKHVVNRALASIADADKRDYAEYLIDLIIDSTEDPGIPIGNQSSQLIALLYLDGMDHWLKDDLGLMYGRYMDDFFVIHEDKAYLQDLLKQIEQHVTDLGLALNPKTQIFPLRNGIDFLGFHTYLTETGKVIRKVRAKSINNMRRKLKTFRRLVDKGRITLQAVELSYASWLGHIRHGNSHHLEQKMNKLFYELFPEIKAIKEERHGAKAKRSRNRKQDKVHKILRRRSHLSSDRP